MSFDPTAVRSTPNPLRQSSQHAAPAPWPGETAPASVSSPASGSDAARSGLPEALDGTERRHFLSSAFSGAAGGMMLGAMVGGPLTHGIAGSSALAASSADSQDPTTTVSRQALHPPGAPAADSGYSPAMVAQGQRVLFISGQGPEDLQADMETQIRQTFDRIGILLKAANATFANVVMVRSYWVHILRDIPIFRKVRKEYLVEPYPTSTAVGTPELAIPGLELEIEVIAVI